MFHSLNEFLQMGGYAHYVWSAYAIAFVILVSNIFLPLREKNKLLRRLSSQQEKKLCIHNVENV